MVSVVLPTLLRVDRSFAFRRTNKSSATLLFAACCFVSLLPDFLPGQQASHYFYHGYSYGSESTFNPVSVFLNGSFDELQIYGQTGAFRDVPWDKGGTNVWRNIVAPFPQVQRYGWERFVRQEIIPTSLDLRRDQWFPNYTLHLIGGGMVARKLSEWYDAHGYPLPTTLSAITAMSYHFVNEIIENGDGGFYANVDPIADLLLFDPLGILLFSSDEVADFFSNTLSLNDWSFAPALSFAPLAARNVGQNFVIKYPLSSSRRTSLFYHFGSFGLLGLSLKMTAEESFSFGFGGSSKFAYTVDSTNGTRTQSIELGPMAGLYWDRNNSLLASLVVADSFTDIVRLNVFPGVISVGGVSPGVFVAFGRNGGYTIGATASFVPVGVCLFFP